jgi:murein DD-endopeptidase MepM/ murein hydrolase activator NlpD
MAGFRDFMFDQPPGRGGADSSLPSRTLSFTELSDQLEWLNRQLDDRTDKLDVLHSLMRAESARKKLMPSVLPIDGAWQSSTFGWRIDPFNAARAFHEGMDLIAPPGTSVLAAASGVVIGAEFHAQYGNMVEIAHGNGLVTRYGHLSKSLVKVGDIVSSGGKIGEVGSTGRATGPHVHFEVRQNGAPLNPMRFLRSRG